MWWWGLVVLCPSLGFTTEWLASEARPMSKWITASVATRTEFVRHLRRHPELIVVRGVLFGRYGSQSLRTVLDEFPEVYVENPVTGWSILLVRRRGNGIAIFGRGK